MLATAPFQFSRGGAAAAAAIVVASLIAQAHEALANNQADQRQVDQVETLAPAVEQAIAAYDLVSGLSDLTIGGEATIGTSEVQGPSFSVRFGQG